jgi:DNA-binding NarL/FixJ family response regulator
MSRVLIVDNHAFTLSTLNAALIGQGLSTLACNSAREALAQAPTFSPEAAVLDFDLGTGPTGIDLALRLRELFPQLGIVLLTSYRDPRLHSSGLPALPAGVIYLCKSDLNDVNALLQAIDLVRRAPLVRRNSVFKPRGASAALTDTQVEVLVDVASGATNAHIAKTRGVTESAIEQTIARIIERLQIEKDSEQNPRVQLTRAYQQLRELDGA